MNINSVDISGHVTRDAELRYTQGGTAILHFCLAVNERRKKPSSDEWVEYPNFIDCVRFGESCEYWQKRLARGAHVTVHGRLRYSSWEKDGEKRSKVEVIAETIDAWVPRGGDQQGQQVQQPQPQGEQPRHIAPPRQDVYDEDIPF